MTVDDKLLSDLEFEAVREALQAETATPLGALRASALRPSADPVEVAREQAITLEALRHLEEKGALPFGTLLDITPILDRLGVDGQELGAREVLDVLAVMRAGRDLRAELAPAREAYPGLWRLAADLPDIGNLFRFLDGKIGPQGTVLDHASDTLAGLRAELRRASSRLDAVLARVLERPEVGKALMDDFVALRSERHVIPIRAESRGAVAGIVHAISGSGATVFLEPLETVELNNEIVTLREQEAAEVRRLLREYSDLLRGRLPELRALAHGVGGLDLAMARARLGRRQKAVPAAASEAEALQFVAARHPLVEESLRREGATIVPLDLELGPDQMVLVLSGPNTGGKTVALKTLGLLAVMHQSGLLVPAREARLPVYRSIHLDIGDRQSIADRLSTFSARVQAIRRMAATLDAPALVLLDEVGSGTDPEEGVALAIAVIDHFRRRGARVLATTHLEALKAYAATTPSCGNAAMQFDETKGSPTYRLAQGVPGRSSALETAERLGLPADILAEARARRGDAGRLLDDYLKRLEVLTTDLEEKTAAAEREAARLREDRAAFERGLEEREARLRERAAADIDKAVVAARAEGERYLAGLRDREIVERLRREEDRLAARLRDTAHEKMLEVTGRTAPAVPTAPTLSPGTRVRVRGLGLDGVVESLQGDRVAVVARGKRLLVPRADCAPEGARPPAGPAPLPEGIRLERRPVVASQGVSGGLLDLRGIKVEEALARLDKFLDDASVDGRDEVRLHHGIGSGRLRRAVHELLHRHPLVARYGAAAEDDGGDGTTIVTLR
ncbi:MAG TPA: Smr/MutS family protein [Candidatus Polarisedimenticolia bacterium]|nr:Smr/MutS family protein [Candidatus Polarisedimenticolia bacterium]